MKYENALATVQLRRDLDRARATLRATAAAGVRYFTASEAAALGYAVSSNYHCAAVPEDYQGAFGLEASKRGRTRVIHNKYRSIYYVEQAKDTEEDLPCYPIEAIE